MSLNKKKWCMDFSNSEIRKFLIDKLVNDMDCRFIIDDSYVSYSCEEDFEYVTFDGENQEFYISFLKSQTSLFIYEHEIMFIDDDEKKFYTSSDVYGNVVYEGYLKSLSHEQILSILYKLVKLFSGVKKIEVTQKQLLTMDKGYPKFSYTFRIINPLAKNGVYQFENIIIKVDNE